jgi:autotransporter-associated beta strand protein
VGRIRSALVALLLGLSVTGAAHAVTWTGSGQASNWSVGDNWGGLPPVGSPSQQIIFNNAGGNGTVTFQDLTNPFVLNKLSFLNQAFTINTFPLQFVPLGTTNPSIQQNGASAPTINAGLVFSVDTTINGGAGNGGIILNGLISGIGGLIDNIPTTFGAGALTLGGPQVYNGPVTLVESKAIASNGGAQIVFASTVDAASGAIVNLAVNTAGPTVFGGSIGGTARLAGLTTNAAGTVTFGGPGVATTGTQIYNEPAATFAGSSVNLDSSGGNITFAGTLNGAPTAVQVNAVAGTVTFGGALGGTAPPASLATVSTNLTAGAISVAGNVDIQASNNLSTGPVVSTTGSVFVAGTTISVPSITAANGVGVFVHGTGTVGVVAGPGGFNKNGGGSVTLAGVNTYTGPTVVQGGVLHVSGSIAASSGVTVNNFQVFVADTPQTVRSLTLTPGATGMVGGSALKVGDGTAAAPLTIIPFPSLPPPFPQDKTLLQLQGHGLIVDYSPGNE